MPISTLQISTDLIGSWPKTQGAKRHHDIIVTFATYNARQRVYLKRMDLRNSEDDEMKVVFINADFTKQRSKLLVDARSLVRVDIFVRWENSHAR